MNDFWHNDFLFFFLIGYNQTYPKTYYIYWTWWNQRQIFRKCHHGSEAILLLYIKCKDRRDLTQQKQTEYHRITKNQDGCRSSQGNRPLSSDEQKGERPKVQGKQYKNLIIT